jgi:NTE family protein
MVLAAGYDAKRLTETLDAFDFGLIADYGSPIHLLGVARDLIFHESIVKGDELTNWIGELLAGSPDPDIAASINFGELTARTGRELIVVGTDLAHSRMVVFPADVALYQDRNGKQLIADEFPVAKAVRISAGYPYFFPPVGGLWDRSTKEEGVFVDGGVTASFPVFVFDNPEPKHPTWGFHLHSGLDAKEDEASYRPIGGIEWPKQMLEGVLDSAINALDKFTERRFDSRVIPIPTGKVSTLNFNLSKEEKKYLYDSGLQAAQKFFAGAPKPTNSYGKP